MTTIKYSVCVLASHFLFSEPVAILVAISLFYLIESLFRRLYCVLQASTQYTLTFHVRTSFAPFILMLVNLYLARSKTCDSPTHKYARSLSWCLLLCARPNAPPPSTQLAPYCARKMKLYNDIAKGARQEQSLDKTRLVPNWTSGHIGRV